MPPIEPEQAYGFPVLDLDSICDTLGQWQINVKPSQLRNPSSDFVFNIYAQILQRLMGMSEGTLSQVVDEGVDSLNTPHSDIYRQALARNVVAHQIARLCAAARIGDYSSRDLAMPDAMRTIVILSGIINFLAHVQGVMDRATHVREDAASIREQRDRLVQQVKKSQDEVAKLRAKRTEEEELARSLRKAHEETVPQIMASLASKSTLENELNQIKGQREQVAKGKESIISDIRSLQERIQATQNRIVRSPERIKKNISIMGTTVAEDRRILATNETKIRDLQAKQTTLLNIEKEVRTCVEQLQTLEREVKNLANTEKQLADARDRQDQKAMEKETLLLKKERVLQQRTNAQEKLERTRRQAADRQAASAQMLARLQREYSELAAERRDNDREVEALNKESDEIERRMAEHLRTSEDELSELLSVYWELRQQTQLYMDALGSKLGFRD